eukprot:3805765-Rhodomonas_salina.1
MLQLAQHWEFATEGPAMLEDEVTAEQLEDSQSRQYARHTVRLGQAGAPREAKKCQHQEAQHVLILHW